MTEEKINKNEILLELIELQMGELASKVYYNVDYIQKIDQEPLLFVSKRMFSQDEEIMLELKVTYIKRIQENFKSSDN